MCNKSLYLNAVHLMMQQKFWVNNALPFLSTLGRPGLFLHQCIHLLPDTCMCIGVINILIFVLKVTLVAVGEDKFSKLLQVCHNTLAALLEVCWHVFKLITNCLYIRKYCAFL